MSTRYLEFEAAIAFGGGLQKFLRMPQRLRAEAVAHLIVKNTRSLFEAEAGEKARDAGKAKPAAESPMERQRRKWMLGN